MSEITKEAEAIAKAIEQNDGASLKRAVQEYAKVTPNPHLDPNQLSGRRIPFDAMSDQLILDDKNLSSPEQKWIGGLSYNVANDCRKQKKYELAIEMYQFAAMNDDNPSVYNNMAVTYKKMKQYDKALECHIHIINTFSDYNPVFARLAILIEAYGLNSEKPAKHYAQEYFNRGGTVDQFRAFVTGTDYGLQEVETEEQAINRLLQGQEAHLRMAYAKKLIESNSVKASGIWTMNMLVHVRVDLPEDHAVLDPVSARQLAELLGITVSEVNGIRAGITSLPYKNKKASVTLRVLSEEVDFRHIALSPAFMKHMGTETVLLHDDIYKM